MFVEFKQLFLSARLLVILLTIAVSVYLFQTLWGLLAQFSDILLMLLFAWLLSFILEPFVDYTEKYCRFSRVLAASTVYFIFIGFISLTIFLFIPNVSYQIQQLIPLIPLYFSAAPPFVLAWINSLSRLLDNSLPLLSSVAQFIFSLFIVIIISFYFNVDRDRIRREWYHLLPDSWHPHIQFAETVTNTIFASFLRVQVLFGLLAGIATWVILRLFGVDFAASTALLAGLLTIIPLVGGVLGIIPPVMVAFISNPTKALFVGITILLMQQVLFNMLGPKLMSRAFNLHPIIILLSFFIGFKIAGGAGAIFAIPVFGILTIFLKKFTHHLSHKEPKK